MTQAREFRYAREMVAMGIAALVIDSFKPRGITTTISDQESVSALEMAQDAFAALKELAAHPRINAGRVGIFGFSKGGIVSLLTAMDRHASRALPAGLRFAVHVPFYPGCGSHYYRPKGTGAPLYMLLGADDTYTGVAPCTEYAGILKAAGWKVDVKIYPDATHAWDTLRAYDIATGENHSRCIFVEQRDGSWKERTSGQMTNDKTGKRIEAGYQEALARCRFLGVSGKPNPAVQAAALADLKAILQRHLLDAK